MYKIYISTFGQRVIKVDGGVPIEVGAANRNNFIYQLHDNAGENISTENEYYGELTGLYWIWKNTDIQDDDIIGFCHYNKSLNISEKKARQWLNQNPTGFITLEPCWVRDHPVEEEVAAWCHSLSTFGGHYIDAFHFLYDDKAEAKGEVCRGGNMFIANGITFKKYCEWLFGICNKVREEVGDKSNVEPNMRRYCAYCGERMLAVYIYANNLPALGIKRRYKKWWLPFIRSIVKFFNINRNSIVYKYLSKKYGYVSQYKKNS